MRFSLTLELKEASFPIEYRAVILSYIKMQYQEVIMGNIMISFLKILFRRIIVFL